MVERIESSVTVDDRAQTARGRETVWWCLASDTRPFGVAQFAGVPHHSGSYDPVIEETVASHGCRLHAAHACGDHHIVVGEVESLEA